MPDLFVFPDLGQFMYTSTLGLPPNNASPFPFHHEIHRPLPVGIFCHHSDGTIVKWVANFAQRSELSTLLTMEHISRCSGHCYPITALYHHPSQPFLASIGRDPKSHHAEVVVWKVGSVSQLSAEPQNALHAIAHLTSTDVDAFSAFSWMPSLKLIAFFVNFDATHVRAYELNLDVANAERVSLGQTPSTSFTLSCLGLLRVPVRTEAHIQPLLQAHHQHSRIDSLHVHSDFSDELMEASWVVAFQNTTATFTVWRTVIINDTKSFVLYSHCILAYQALGLPVDTARLGSVHSPSSPWGPTLFSATKRDDNLLFMGRFEDRIIRCWTLRILDAPVKDTDGPTTIEALLGQSPSPSLQLATSLSGESKKQLDKLLFSTSCSIDRINDFDISFAESMYTSVSHVAFAATGRVAVVVQTGSARNKDTATNNSQHGLPVSRVYVFERQSSGKAFNPEEVLDFDEPVRSVDWISINGHRHLLAVFTPSRLQIFAHSRSRLGSWIPIVTNPTNDSESGLLSWAHDGLLVIARGNRLQVFSKWADHYEVDSFRTLSSAPKDSALEHVFALAELLHGSLPFYHPKQITGLLMAGKFDLVDRIFFSLWKTLVVELDPQEVFSTTSRFSSMASQISFNLSQFSLIQHFSETERSSTESATLNKASSKVNVSYLLSSADEKPDEQRLNEEQSLRLGEKLSQISLPELTNIEQLHFLALLQSFADIKAHRKSLDVNGMRFYILVKLFQYLQVTLPPQFRPQALKPIDFTWAFHSESQDVLLNLCFGMNTDDIIEWSDLCKLGFGSWLKSVDQLKKVVERVAKGRFQKTQDPLKCALFYLALRRKNVLWGLFKTKSDARMSGFFGNNFEEQRWKEAALKNAYALMGKQKFEESAAFFLLGGCLEEAVHICLESLKDVQLALVISRVYDGDSSPVYKNLMESSVLWPAMEVRDFALASIAHWLLKDYKQAYEVLKNGPSSPAQASSNAVPMAESSSPMMLNLCQFVQEHSLVRTHAQSTGISAVMFHKAIYEYSQLGLPILALDTLLKLESELERASQRAIELELEKAVQVAKPATKAPTTNVSDMISSGTFSFDAFDDGYGNYDEEEPAPAATVPDLNNSTASAITDSDSDSKFLVEADRELLHSFRWSMCTQILCESLRLLNKGGEWIPIRARVQTDWVAIRQICDLYDSKYEDAMQSGGIENQLKIFCRLNNLTHSEGALTGLDPDMRLELLSIFVTHINDFIRAETLAQLGTVAELKPIAYNRCKKIVRHTFEYYHQLQVEVQKKNSSALTSLIVCEVLFACYIATFITAWSCKDWDTVLKILTNSLNKSILQRILNSNSGIRSSFGKHMKTGSIVSPKAGRANTHDAPTRAPPTLGLTQSLYFYFMTEPPVSSYSRVDENSDADYDGKAEPDAVYDSSPTTPTPTPPAEPADATARASSASLPASKAGNTPAPSTSSSAKPSAVPEAETEADKLRFCWTLLELVAFQFVCNELRDARDTLNMDTDEVNRLSPFVFGVFTALEVRISKLEARLDTLRPPARFVESTPADQSYPSQSLFKIRGLLDIAANPFKTVPVRRLWHLLVNTSSVQDTIEHFVFRRSKSDSRQMPAMPTPSTAQLIDPHGPPWNIAFKASVNDITSLCICHTNSDTFAIATPKGITELKSARTARMQTATGGGLRSMISASNLFQNKDSLSLVPILQHGLTHVSRVESHPSMPFYVSGGTDGSVRLWQFEQEQFSCTYGIGGSSKIARIRFDSYGNKFAVLEKRGDVGLWRFGDHDSGRPFLRFQAHTQADGLSFLTSTSFLATGGTAPGSRNVRLWDTLLPLRSAMLKEFEVNDGGNKSLSFVSGNSVLLAGSRRGEMAVIDLRQREIITKFQAHGGSIKTISVNEEAGLYATGGEDGVVRLWSLNSHRALETYAHGPRAAFHGGGAITDIHLTKSMLIVAGKDGLIRTLAHHH